jgi:hypothetical protein
MLVDLALHVSVLPRRRQRIQFSGAGNAAQALQECGEAFVALDRQVLVQNSQHGIQQGLAARGRGGLLGIAARAVCCQERAQTSG